MREYLRLGTWCSSLMATFSMLYLHGHPLLKKCSNICTRSLSIHTQRQRTAKTKYNERQSQWGFTKTSSTYTTIYNHRWTIGWSSNSTHQMPTTSIISKCQYIHHFPRHSPFIITTTFTIYSTSNTTIATFTTSYQNNQQNAPATHVPITLGIKKSPTTHILKTIQSCTNITPTYRHNTTTMYTPKNRICTKLSNQSPTAMPKAKFAYSNQTTKPSKHLPFYFYFIPNNLNYNLNLNSVKVEVGLLKECYYT